jgi:hypothetical protein
VAGANADSTGAFSFKVPPGTYKINAAAGPDYVPPAPVTVTVADNEAKSGVSLVFSKTDGTITGTVTLGGVAQANAFVRAYPSGGGVGRSTKTGSDGKYTLGVNAGSGWVVQALAETTSGDTTTYYRSEKASVAVPASGSATQDLALASVGAVPAPISISFDVSQDQTVTLSDGTQVIIPAGAMGSSGDATLRVTPKTQVVETQESRTLSFAYELVALDSAGQPITRFNSPVNIVLKYDVSALPAGVSPTDLIPQYYDTVSGSWKHAENVVLNKTDSTITISVTHFTDYAITTETSTSYRQLVPLGPRQSSP